MQPKPPIRFVLDGQKGQAGGRGDNGKAGHDASYVANWKGLGKTADKTFRNVVHLEKTWFAGTETKGGDKPTNGTDALSGGAPGNGGRAGDLITNLALDVVALAVSQKAGGAGPTTPAYYGGREGWPSTWRHIKSDGINAWLVKEGKTTQGKGKPKREAKPGTAGELKSAADAAWLAPELVSLRAELVRETYLNGHHALARQVCVDHLRAVAKQPYVRDDPRTASDHRDLLTFARRLRSGLDYFGNPPGWAPMLSLETTIDTYRAGIDESIRLLAVAAWADRNWDDLEQRRRSLEAAIGLQRGRIEHHLRAHADARQMLPRLRSELDKADRDTQRFIGQLEAKEIQISETFKHDEEKRKLAADAIAAIKSGIEIAATGTGGAAAAVGMGGLTFVESQLAPKPPGPDSDSTTAALNAMIAADDQAAARERFLAMGVGADVGVDAFLDELRRSATCSLRPRARRSRRAYRAVHRKRVRDSRH